LDLRKRIVARHAKGDVTYAPVAELFDIGAASVSRLLRRGRERGDLHPDPIGGGYPPRIPEEQLPKLAALVAEKPEPARDVSNPECSPNHHAERPLGTRRAHRPV
jgi:transposase